MLRVVLAALVAVALLGVAAPAVEDAREERSARLLAGELDALAAAAVDLSEREEAAPPNAAARRVRSVRVPGDGLAEAPVAYVAVGGLPDRDPAREGRGDVLAYRLVGSDPRVRHVPVDLRVRGPDGTVRTDGTPLVLRGDARVTLSLVERDGGRVVLVRRES